MDFFDVLLAKKLENDQDPTIEGLSVTENGRYEQEGVVYKPVIVNVPQPTMRTLNATANGQYTPEQGEAYNEVNVAVPLPANAYLKKSVSGLPQPIASFSDGADAPLNSLTASIVPVQSGSGDPSPTNVRPITGWTEEVITVTDDLQNPTVTHTTTIPFTDSQGQSVEVFGGSVDVVNGGEQPRTLGKIIVDENTDVKVYGGWRFYFDVPNFVSPAYNVVANIQCDKLTTRTKNSMPNTNSISAYDTGGARMIISVNDTITTVEDMKVWLANNPLEIVYELATPTTFYTQPTSIKSLDGVNNVFASTGDVTECEYFGKEST